MISAFTTNETDMCTGGIVFRNPALKMRLRIEKIVAEIYCLIITTIVRLEVLRKLILLYFCEILIHI